jgi:hypothetical protein
MMDNLWADKMRIKDARRLEEIKAGQLACLDSTGNKFIMKGVATSSMIEVRCNGHLYILSPEPYVQFYQSGQIQKNKGACQEHERHT